MGTQLPFPKWNQNAQFSAHFYCGQTAGWIMMALGMEVGLNPGEFVLDGFPTPPQKGAEPSILGPRLLWPNGCMDQDATWYEGRRGPSRHCIRWGPSSPKRGTAPHLLANVYCGQMAGWIKMPLGTEIGLGPGHIVLDGDLSPPPEGTASPPPIFGLYVLWPNGRPSQVLLRTCLNFKQTPGQEVIH